MAKKSARLGKQELGMTELKKLDKWSVGKVCALLGAFWGFSIFYYKISSMPEVQQMPGFSPVNTGQLIGLPFWYLVIFGIVGGIGGILCSLIYNQIARTGGMKFRLK